MDNWEFNKIAAAVLAALLVIFGGKEIIYIAGKGHAKEAQKAGYVLPVEVASASGLTAGVILLSRAQGHRRRRAAGPRPCPRQAV